VLLRQCMTSSVFLDSLSVLHVCRLVTWTHRIRARVCVRVCVVQSRLAEASDPWLRHFWTNSAFRPPLPAPPSAAGWSTVSLSHSRRPSEPPADLLQTVTTLDSRSDVNNDLRELERFASSFKSRRIRLGFTQTNVG